MTTCEKENLRLENINDCNQNIIKNHDELIYIVSDLGTVEEDSKTMHSNTIRPERDYSINNNNGVLKNQTTYDDIVSFLETFENDCPQEGIKLIGCDLSKVYSSVECQPCQLDYANRRDTCSNSLKENLATTKLQIEENHATIQVLRDQLKNERTSACEKFEAQKKALTVKLNNEVKKYQTIVKRHQKFIEQILSEKKLLAEKCECLTQRIRDMENKISKDLKVVEERHAVELQKIKERCAASEKIRREKWVDAKTTKIKEMTVKGLEPELRNMIDQHQREIQDLRNAHIKEIQDTELRVIRQSNQQLDELHLELTASHEKMLANEKNIIWKRFNEKLNEREKEYREKEEKLLEEFKREKIKFMEEQARRDKDKNNQIEEINSRRKEEIEKLKQQHENKESEIKELLKIEWEKWFNDYKKTQSENMQRERNKINEEHKRQRDKEIELAIHHIEKESRQMKTTIIKDFENKYKCMEESYRIKLQTAIDNENIVKLRLTSVERKLQDLKICEQEIEEKLEECTKNLNNANHIIKNLTMERDNAKKLARQEIESEKRILEDKIASLYQEFAQNNSTREASMVQLRNRIKLIITQKTLTIKCLTKQVNELKDKCEHLERLLDHQRKEYILNPL